MNGIRITFARYCHRLDSGDGFISGVAYVEGDGVSKKAWFLAEDGFGPSKLTSPGFHDTLVAGAVESWVKGEHGRMAKDCFKLNPPPSHDLLELRLCDIGEPCEVPLQPV